MKSGVTVFGDNVNQRIHSDAQQCLPCDTRAGLRFGWAIIVIAWCSAVGIGMAILYTYEAKPSSYNSYVATWPAQTSLIRDVDKFHIIMFLHPQCPCSRASLAEMERVLARASGRASVDILFVRPTATDESWVRTELWRRAAATPGVRVKTDIQGTEAANFGAIASGHVVMYASDGRLVFSGGITQSRGHEGANDGRSAMISAFSRLHALKTVIEPVLTPTYGCLLRNSRDDDK